MHDIVFLHPPVSFKKIDYPLSGIFESATGTTDLLTMMPVGMLSLANELHACGLNTVILNIAKVIQSIREGSLDSIEDWISKYRARIFAIDLHWAAHSAGAIALSEICKQIHPTSLVILGGLTATYYAEEILKNYNSIDAIVCGECDGHMEKIYKALVEAPPDYAQAPNLAYRGESGIKRNLLLDPILSVVDYLDSNHLILPGESEDRMDRETVLSNIPILRGCNRECLFCGGSRSAYKKHFGRDRYEMLPVEVVCDHIQRSVEKGVTGIKFFGDVRLGGASYVDEIVRCIDGLSVSVDIALEIFWPAEESFLRSWREVSKSLYLSFSPESSLPELRKLHEKSFTNREMLEFAQLCQDLDILVWFWFVYLLPGHTPEALKRENEVLRKLLALGENITINIQPYLFIDPASPIFENPDIYGFQIEMRKLEDVIQRMERAYWYYSIGYATANFSKPQFFEAILEKTEEVATMYFEKRRLSARDLLKTKQNLKCQRAIGSLLQAHPDSEDERIQKEIERVFPAYLRQSNSSLMIWPFFGERIENKQYIDSLLVDAFPTCLELVLQKDIDQTDDVVQKVEEWQKKHAERILEYLLKPLPSEVFDMVQGLFEKLQLPTWFASELIEFEWDVYRLLSRGESPAGVEWRKHFIMKCFLSDMIDVSEVIASSNQDFVRNKTWYLFRRSTRSVYSMNFDPTAMEKPQKNWRVRRMSTLGRRLIYAEKTVVKVIERMSGAMSPHLPEIVAKGGNISPDLWDLITG